MAKTHQWDDLNVPVDLMSNGDSSSGDGIRVHESRALWCVKSISYHLGLTNRGPRDGELRTLFIGGRSRNEVFDFPDNTVVTARYNVITFLPKFAVESFSKFANTYFLIVSIFQAIPLISITDGIPLTLGPLAIVLFFEGLITALEDRGRHKDDNTANASNTNVMENGIAVQKTWKDVQVGDVLKLRNRDPIPADLLILAASDEPPQGVCYVETKSLDGETNLKLKQGPIETAEAIDAYARSLMATQGKTKEQAMDQAVSTVLGKVVCETPNAHLDTFNGSATFRFDKADGTARQSDKIPLNLKNILLRGCTVRSTDYVYGLVVNTGHDTKIMQSMVQTKAKMSTLDTTINHMLLGFVLLEIFICLLGAGLAWDWVKNTSWDDYYLGGMYTLSDFFVRACTFFLLIANMIPLSLYVSMKIIRVAQSVFILWDLELVNAGEDPLSGEPFVHKARVRTMDLCDTIGQISFVFSDKTGTLTNNVMEFRKMSIGGKAYGQGTTIIGVAALERDGKMEEALKAREFLQSVENTPHPRFINFVEDQFGAHLERDEIAGSRDFLTALALCHEVLVESIRDDQGVDTGETRLSASSPDDQALVVTAAEMGFRFKARGDGGRSITVCECGPSIYVTDAAKYAAMSPESRRDNEDNRPGKDVVYDLLQTLEFTSSRKRASVIVRDRARGDIRLYTKGADSEVFKRLTPASRQSAMATATMAQVTSFADDGLRTLTVAYKRLSESEFSSWNARYLQASTNVQEQEKRKNKEENAIDSLMDEIESGMELLGATAIEDKLQEQVPETIKSLAEAGIRLWVLTGDKEETAINIAWACQLLDHSMSRIVINSNSAVNKDDMAAVLRRYHGDVVSSNSGKNYALVIDGPALKLAMIDPDLPMDAKSLNLECERMLIDIAVRCKGVVCCRVSPKQKAEVVKMVRKYLKNERTLAVGDGANDVGMIQSAHVGVGISGLEGMQAVNAADVSIGRFKFLKRLLLLHGRTNYRRTAKLIVLILYKNIFMILCQIFWSHANGFSGQRLYFQLGVEGYNIFFTNSILFTAIFDKDLPDRYLLQIPALYELGRESQLFNFTVFWTYVLNAWYQAILAYVFMYFAYQVPYQHDAFMMGTMVFTIICVIANTKVALEVYAWNSIMAVGYFFMFISWPLAALLLESRITIGVRFGWEFQDVFSAVLRSPNTWAIWPVLFTAVLLRDVAWKCIKREWFPELRHILQEHAKLSGHPFNYRGPVGDLSGGITVISQDVPYGAKGGSPIEIVTKNSDEHV